MQMTHLKRLTVALVAAFAVMAGSASAASADLVTNIRTALVNGEHLRSIHATFIDYAGGGQWGGAFCTGVYYYAGGVKRYPSPHEFDTYGTYTNNGYNVSSTKIFDGGTCDPNTFDYFGPIFHFPPHP